MLLIVYAINVVKVSYLLLGSTQFITRDSTVISQTLGSVNQSTFMLVDIFIVLGILLLCCNCFIPARASCTSMCQPHNIKTRIHYSYAFNSFKLYQSLSISHLSVIMVFECLFKCARIITRKLCKSTGYESLSAFFLTDTCLKKLCIRVLQMYICKWSFIYFEYQ